MSANTYTPDSNFIIDATGKQWPVETPHELPLPEGIETAYDQFGCVSVVTAGQGPENTWGVYVVDESTHWLARRPLPPVPKKKTQEELDEEAFKEFFNQRFPLRHIETWSAALAYARKGAK